MGKPTSKRASLSQQTLLTSYGEIYVWLHRRRDRILRELEAEIPGLWQVCARAMARDGVKSRVGGLPNRHSVRHNWLLVARDMAKAIERRAKAEAAKPVPGHKSRLT